MIPLLLFAWLILLSGPITRRLAAARWVYQAPRLAVGAWHVVAASAASTLLLAGLTMALHWDRTHDVICDGWRICLDALRGTHGTLAQAIAALGSVLMALLLLRTLAAAQHLWRTVRCRRRHAALVAAVGQPAPDWRAMVLADGRPAAYLVPGRHGQVVVTSGAVQVLPSDELNAVLAHEHAHRAAGHHRMLDPLRLLHHAVPLPAFGLAHRQVARLVEMCADDSAARTHSRLALARALVTLAAASPPPVAVLRADGGDTAERLTRLVQPPPGLSRPVAAVVIAAMIIVAVLPIAVTLLERVLSG